jgi:hypothetical protein
MRKLSITLAAAALALSMTALTVNAQSQGASTLNAQAQNATIIHKAACLRPVPLLVPPLLSGANRRK